MRLELKNIKCVESRSEETYCYRATLYRDGRAVAEVSNDGRGGADRVLPCGGATWDTIREIEAYVAGFPPIEAFGMHLTQTLETWCAQQVERTLTRRTFRRLAQKTVLFLDPARPGVRSVKHPTRTVADLIGYVRGKFPGATILNELPEEQALALFQQHAAKR